MRGARLAGIEHRAPSALYQDDRGSDWTVPGAVPRDDPGQIPPPYRLPRAGAGSVVIPHRATSPPTRALRSLCGSREPRSPGEPLRCPRSGQAPPDLGRREAGGGHAGHSRPIPPHRVRHPQGRQHTTFGGGSHAHGHHAARRLPTRRRSERVPLPTGGSGPLPSLPDAADRHGAVIRGDARLASSAAGSAGLGAPLAASHGRRWNYPFAP